MRRGKQVVAAAIAIVALLAAGWHLYGSPLHLKLLGLWAPTTDVERQQAPKAAAAPARLKSQGPAASQASKAASPDAPEAPRAPASPVAIEVARVDVVGASVVAGRAPAGSRVNILANGRQIASAVASDGGQWAVVVTSGITAGRLDLTAVAIPEGGGAELKSPVASLEVPEDRVATLTEADRPAGAAGEQARAGTVAQKTAARRDAGHHELMRFEEMVKQARREAAAEAAQPGRLAAAPRPNDGFPQAASTRAAPLGTAEPGQPVQRIAATPGASNAVAPAPKLVPVPITFESDATDMTSNGRRAADLLAEYLRLKKPRAITLTGHADVRGTDEYNLELSRRRLEAIERHLRTGGYAGRLALIPKGKSEPYRAIDRGSLSIEEIWQIDRRVELRLIE